MASKGTTIITPGVVDPTRDVQVFADEATNALLVKVVNPGGGGGGGAQYLEDSPHVSGDTGTMALVVRKDVAGALAGTDGDYAPLQVDASGALRVVVSGGGGSGGTEFAEDSAHVSGALGTLSLAVRQDTPGSLTSTDGDYASLQVDAVGRLRVSVDSSVALSVAVSNFPATVAVTQSTSPWVIGDGGGSITVDGTLAVTQSTSPWVVSGTVAVSSVVPGTGVTNLGKALGSTVGVTDVGVGAWAVEQTTGNYAPLLVHNSALVGVLIDGAAGSGECSVKQAGMSYVFANDAGIPPVFVVELGDPALAAGEYTFGRTDDRGSIWVNVQTSTPLTASITAVVPGVTATSLGKAEDAIHGTGDVGVMALAVRADTAAATGANGDYVPLLTDSTGKLHVNVGNASIPVTQSGTWNIGTVTTVSAVSAVTPGTGATNLGKAEDAGHTTGDVGVMSLAVRKDVPGSLAGTDLDYAPLQLNSGGELRVQASMAAPVETYMRDPSSGNIMAAYADADGAPGGGGGAAIGNAPMAEVVPSLPSLTVNTWNHLYMTTDGLLQVHVPNSITISGINPGTSASALGKNEDSPHTTADTGVMALAVRQDTLANSTSTDGDYAALKVDGLGALYVNMGNPTSLADGQFAASLGALYTVPASTRVRVESFDIYNTSSTLTETVRIQLKQNGGTSRQIRQYTLGPGESASVIAGDSFHLEASDVIEGFTTTASTVNFFITGVVR